MIYKIGDKLKCKKEIDTRCFEMSNPAFTINAGDIYIITDKDTYPDDYKSHWYELTSEENKNIILNAWNDKPDHMILDNIFEKLG